MGDAISKIGSVFSNLGGHGGSKWGAVIPGALGLAGLYGNIKGAQQRGSVLGNLEASRKRWANMSPAQVAQEITAAEQPLSRDLFNAESNQVGAMMAERGLAQSPGIFAATMAQALAPYQQANRDAAMRIVMNQMGLPGQYAQEELAAIPQGSDLSGPLAMVMRSLGGGGTGGDDYGGGGSMTPDASTRGLGVT